MHQCNMGTQRGRLKDGPHADGGFVAVAAEALHKLRDVVRDAAFPRFTGADDEHLGGAILHLGHAGSSCTPTRTQTYTLRSAAAQTVVISSAAPFFYVCEFTAAAMRRRNTYTHTYTHT